MKILEEKLKKQADTEAFKEFLEAMKSIEYNITLQKAFPYMGQHDVWGVRHVSLYGTKDVEKIEEGIRTRSEQIYEMKVNDLLKKMESLEYLFGQV